MNCVRCGRTMVHKNQNRHYEDLLIEDVPLLECVRCEEVFVHARTMNNIKSIYEEYGKTKIVQCIQYDKLIKKVKVDTDDIFMKNPKVSWSTLQNDINVKISNKMYVLPGIVGIIKDENYVIDKKGGAIGRCLHVDIDKREAEILCFTNECDNIKSISFKPIPNIEDNVIVGNHILYAYPSGNVIKNQETVNIDSECENVITSNEPNTETQETIDESYYIPDKNNIHLKLSAVELNIILEGLEQFISNIKSDMLKSVVTKGEPFVMEGAFDDYVKQILETQELINNINKIKNN